MTIEEFARKIGVSSATVSRAIHGKGRINPQTRQMVLQRMEELGFTPNLHAQNLAHRRSRTIGLEYLGRTEVALRYVPHRAGAGHPAGADPAWL
jgi:DNA-binding LacI/PurR family transcriptional regulator